MGFERTTAQILVDMDLTEGFPVEMDIIWDEGIFVQKIDYWKVAFHCHCYRQTGHSKFTCPSLGKFLDKARHGMDEQDTVIKEIPFLLPLDKASAMDFIGKFT